jgi:hypothetical protein
MTNRKTYPGWFNLFTQGRRFTMSIKRISSCLAFTALLAVLPKLTAQTFEGQITGVVKDASGGVIPGAHLVVTNIAAGATFNAVTDNNGIYRFPALPPTAYKITCVFKGFNTLEQGPITLQVNQVLELNLTLSPGQTTERVNVTAQAPPLETQSGTLGQIVTTRSIENLPLNVRDPMALIALTPGVVLGSGFGANASSSVARNFFKSDFYVGGGRSGSQEILLDGAPDTTPDINRGIINPPVDSVQEFKVQVNTYDASFGRTSGGIINIITKAGTNDFHGVAYEFERHSILDANNFFNNRAGLANPSFARHQFGGNTGGRVIKNKVFFFADYEGLRQGYPATSVSTVPLPQQRTGDFSQTYAPNGSLITIYDPNTTVILANGSTRSRSPFPGNVIPSARFDPVAINTLSYYPLANTAGSAITGQNNYVYSPTTYANSDKYDLRGDANLDDKTRTFFRFSHQNDLRGGGGALPSPLNTSAVVHDIYTQAIADVTHVFNPNLVLDVQTSFSRGLAIQLGVTQGFDLTKLGFASTFANQVVAQFPTFSFSDITGTAGGAAQSQPRNVFATLGSVTYLHGRHSFKFGGDWRVLDFNEGQNSIPTGSFSFTRAFTQGPNPAQSSATSGYSVASFLLGATASGTADQFNRISTQGLYFGSYIQDDWKATSNLTLNMGLRWDVEIGNREKFNRLAYFNPTATSSLAAAANLPGLAGQLVWVGQGNPTNQQQTDYKNFAPRFGFAYRVKDKTVIRGGYGIFFIPKNIQGTGYGAIEALRNTSMVGSIDGFTVTNTLSNPFPQGLLPALNDRNPNANVGNAISVPLYNFRTGYAQTWSFGFQRELPLGFLLDAHYWGNKGTALLNSWNIDQLPDQYLALGSKLSNLVANPFYGLISSGALAGKTISLQQSLLPYPQYTGISQVNVPDGNSTYHAGTVQLERRLSPSLTILAAYTRSKAIDDVHTPLDQYNRSIEKSISAFDTPNQFRFSSVWQIPIGSDRTYGRNWSKWARAAVADWDISGILAIQSGQPIAVSRTALDNGQSAKLANRTIAEWFNTSVFSTAPAYTYGNVGPYLPDVRGDFQRNLDAVLVRNFSFHIVERVITSQFRFEVFNVTNTVQFAAPNGTLNTQSFGIVTAQANNPRELQFGLKFKF